MCLQKAFNVAFSLQALDGQRVGPDVTDSRPLVCQGVQADVTPSVGAGGVGRVRGRGTAGELQGELTPQIFIYFAGCTVVPV